MSLRAKKYVGSGIYPSTLNNPLEKDFNPVNDSSCLDHAEEEIGRGIIIPC